MFKKLISIFLSFTFITTQPVFAQGVAQLNMAQYLGSMPTAAADRFRPLHMRYFSYDMEKDNFQLLLDKGDNQDIKEVELQEKTKVLMEYFQIGLALPNEKFWVNLRPDAEDQMIDPELEKTDMGRIMLEADLQLKKDTAGFTSPQTTEGKQYWDKLYKKAGELFGTENITIPTITRPWIVPGEIILRQGEDSAYIFKANMKVMLEHDYLNSPSSGPNSQPLTSNYNFSDPRMKELNEYSTQLIRELIIPKLTKEVNSSKRYAALRQVFFSLVMARWFKDTFQGKPGQYAQLIDSHNLNNLTSKEAWSKTYYFNEYKKSFEQGEYNLKENIYTPTGQVIRSYVSGGVSSAIMEGQHSGYSPMPSGSRFFGWVNELKVKYELGKREYYDFPIPNNFGFITPYLVSLVVDGDWGLGNPFNFKLIPSSLSKNPEKLLRMKMNEESLEEYAKKMAELIAPIFRGYDMEDLLLVIKYLEELEESWFMPYAEDVPEYNTNEEYSEIKKELHYLEWILRRNFPSVEMNETPEMYAVFYATQWSRGADVRQKILENTINKLSGMLEKRIGSSAMETTAKVALEETDVSSAIVGENKERLDKWLKGVALDNYKDFKNLLTGERLDLFGMIGKTPEKLLEGKVSKGEVLKGGSELEADFGENGLLNRIVFTTKDYMTSSRTVKYEFIFQEGEGWVILDEESKKIKPPKPFVEEKIVPQYSAPAGLLNWKSRVDTEYIKRLAENVAGYFRDRDSNLGIKELLLALQELNANRITVDFYGFKKAVESLINAIGREIYSLNEREEIKKEIVDFLKIYFNEKYESAMAKKVKTPQSEAKTVNPGVELGEKFLKQDYTPFIREYINAGFIVNNQKTKDVLVSTLLVIGMLAPRISPEEVSQMLGLIKRERVFEKYNLEYNLIDSLKIIRGIAIEKLEEKRKGELEDRFLSEEGPFVSAFASWVRHLGDGLKEIKLSDETKDDALIKLKEVFSSVKVNNELKPVEELGDKNSQTEYNNIKDTRLPDENSAKTGKELAGKLTSIYFNPSLIESLRDRDQFVFIEGMLRGGVALIQIKKELEGNFGALDISQYTGEALIRLLYSTGVLKYVEGSEVKADSVVSSAIMPPGGIDFRTMNYLVQPMGSFKDLRFGLPTLTSSALERIDLDKELDSLRNMVKAGMVPSGERVKEYLAACFQKGKIEEKQDDLLVCLAEIYRLAEEENLETSPQLRESLVIVDTGKFVLLPNNQKVGLN